jgi:alcohol dehydrogenase class IV
VIVFAPAAFRHTFSADPDKHRRAAELLTGAPVDPDDAEALPRAFVELMRDVGAPRGTGELGYGPEDVEALVAGALKQQRLLAVAPREVGPAELAQIISESESNW